MKTVIPVSAIEIGMFISDLDRPWLDSPFLLQGFLVETPEEVQQLQALCKSVTMDPAHSVGKWLNVIPHVKDQMLSGLGYLGIEDDDEDFFAIASKLKSGKLARRTALPKVDPNTGRSKLEEELLYSAPIVQETQEILHQIRRAIDEGGVVDLTQAADLVGEMEQSVARNPDAMLWLARLKASDQYTYDHALDVSVHLMLFARFLGMEGMISEQLGMVGLMQDIGKTKVSSDILSKPRTLSQEEFELMKRHVAGSLRILARQPGITPLVLEAVANHHERVDGSGYPRGINTERLTIYAELAGLMDTYCAMTRQRAYSSALSTQKALEAIIRLRGTKFRDTIVDQLVQCMGLYPIGTMVELNSGEVAIVIQQNQVRRLQPRLMVVLGPDKSIERFPHNLDLLLNPQTPTGEPYRITRALPPDAYGVDPKEFYLG